MKAFSLLMLSGVLAGAVFIAGKQAGNHQLAPLIILFWQMAGGAVVVWTVSLRSRRFPVWDSAHLRYYLIGGLLGISLPYVLAFVVLQRLQVGTVGLLTALSPVVTYALARVLGMEAGHPLRLLGLMAGLAGVIMLVAPKAAFSESGDWLHLLLALGIPVTLAASNLYRSRYWPADSEALPLVIGMLTVQALCLFAINLMLGNFPDLMVSTSSAGPLLAVLAMVAGTSYLSSFRLLRIGGPVYLSQMGYVITAVTVLFGIAVWGEAYRSTDVLSMGLILSGVLLNSLSQVQSISTSAPVTAPGR